jgi:HSP20 family protein
MYCTPMNRLPGNWNRLMDEMLGPQIQRWSLGGPVNNVPPLAVWEDADAYFVEAELPGLALADIDLFVKDREVTISGKLKGSSREGENRRVYRNERPSGEFKRELRLPLPLDGDRVEATLANGVLTLRLPKAEAAKGRKIEVKAG